MKQYAFKNSTGVTIPAGAVMTVTGEDGNGILTVAQCTVANSLYVVFNGPADVPSGAYGTAFPCSPDTLAAINTADLPYTYSDTFGTVSGDWNIRKGGHGFRVPTQPYQGLANVMPDPVGASSPPAANWSTSAAGILTTNAQSGAGGKTTNPGPGVDGGWWVNSTMVGTAGNSVVKPYYATYTSSSGGYSPTYSVFVGPLPLNNSPVLNQFYSSISFKSAGNSLPSNPTVQCSGLAVSAATPVVATMCLAIGDPVIPISSGAAPQGLGVFRDVAGSPVLQPGIDASTPAGITFVGGIATGYTNPTTTVSLAYNSATKVLTVTVNGTSAGIALM